MADSVSFLPKSLKVPKAIARGDSSVKPGWNRTSCTLWRGLSLTHMSCTHCALLPQQEAVKAAIVEEQRRSEKAMEEAVKRTRDELVEYVREQRRVSVLSCPSVCL